MGCNLEAVRRLSEERRGRPGAVTETLLEIQRLCRHLPEEALQEVARGLGVPLSRLYAAATFYAAFSLTPLGEHQVAVCRGTACHVRGAGRLVDELQRRLGIAPGQTTPDGAVTLEEVRCLGSCSLAPVMAVDGRVHGRLTPERAARVVRLLLGEAGRRECGNS